VSVLRAATGHEPEVSASEGRICVDVAAGSAGGAPVLVEVASALAGAGVVLDDIALRQPTLDEVFLALTGQPMTDQDSDRERVGVTA